MIIMFRPEYYADWIDLCFQELRRLWTFLDQQICAKDELDICKVRLQLKTENETVKVNSTLKNLNYKIESRAETIHLLSVHEVNLFCKLNK